MRRRPCEAVRPPRAPARLLSMALAALLSASLAGCASLLPRGSSEQPSGFDSFESAQRALEQVLPFRTTVAELAGLGFDPEGGRNVTRVPYPEVVTRLAPHPGVPLETLDEGVRACVAAQAQCRAYVFHLGGQTQRREGSFWLDFFNFKRTTAVAGWRFDGLVVVRGELVVFRNFGGEARIDRTERQVNPLGPLQRAGDAVGARILN
ncbi:MULTISPECIES: hypothetical protein [Hydrogenophaga]|uniref:Lipoprotein n=1 Tax=Hydrogenophaga laconesensis TaxID=1805971 RepID=A0ABU1VIP6_9BURK|nr:MULTISPECIES: hypothetical protein [Hydrogenophaga]MDR7097309.1 hypothetical protein [Hydrogenophaga laconesensis]